MPDAIFFAILACACVVQAIRLGGWGWLLLWPGFAFGFLAIVYLVGGVWMFGKRADGTIDRRWGLISLPARALLLAIWHLRNRFAQADAINEIVPGLHLGRRPLRLPAGCELIVDLAGELPAVPEIRGTAGYRSFCVLDRSIGDDASFVELVRLLAADPRPKLVHCAQGHGRSAQVVIAMLVATGRAPDVAAATAQVRSRRPGISLTRSQAAQLLRCEPTLKEMAARPAA